MTHHLYFHLLLLLIQKDVCLWRSLRTLESWFRWLVHNRLSLALMCLKLKEGSCMIRSQSIWRSSSKISLMMSHSCQWRVKRCSRRQESKKFVRLISKKKLFKIKILTLVLLKSLSMTVPAVLTMVKCSMFFHEKLKSMDTLKTFHASESKLITECRIWAISDTPPCTSSYVKMIKVILLKAIF